jgi:hypothetical protein
MSAVVKIMRVLVGSASRVVWLAAMLVAISVAVVAGDLARQLPLTPASGNGRFALGGYSMVVWGRHGTENENVAPGPSFRTAHSRP